MIISTRELPEECHSLLDRWGLEDRNVEEHLKEGEALLAWPSQVKDYVGKMPKLKVIQTFSAGVDDLPFQLIPAHVEVFSNAGAYSTSVAEHAWALALALAKNVNVRRREDTVLLHGGTALVLGGGGIGSEIARIAKHAFDMYVIGVSRSFRRPELFSERRGLQDLKELMGRADVLFDALPLNKETVGLLNYDLLSRTKERVILVNVGRAETVVEEDVIRIMKERKGFKFGTDVFWRKGGKENFDSPLWGMENFAGTPHTAGATASGEVLKRALVRACENLRDYLSEGHAENRVRREDYE